MTLVWLEDLRLNAELTGPPTAPTVVLIHGMGTDLRLWDAPRPKVTVDGDQDVHFVFFTRRMSPMIMALSTALTMS